MYPNRLLGIGVAVAGLFFLAVGLDATHAPLAQLTRAFDSALTHETVVYIAGGLAAIVAGTVVALQSR